MSGDSLTPPLSPEVGFKLEDLRQASPPKIPREEEETRTVCFSCLGEVSNRGTVYHSDGYWRTGFLHRLFSCPSHHTLPVADPYKTFDCFSHTWPGSVLQNYNIEKLFLILRQQIGELQCSAQKTRLSFVIEDMVNGQDIREQTCKFLQYLMDSLLSSTLSEDCLDRLVSNLHSVLLCMGRLCELPHSVLQSPSVGNKGSNSNQCLHLHLDVYWRMLSIFHIIQVKYPGYRCNRKLCVTHVDDLDTSLYDQMLHLVLWDLLCLANVKYMDKVAGHDPQKTAMFSCSCVQELWSLVLKLTEWRAKIHIGESLWISLHHVMKSALEIESQDLQMEVEDCTVMLNPPEGFKTEDAVGLCLWIMYNIAPLYTQNVPGSITNEVSAVSNYHDLQVLLKRMLASWNVCESVLRRHLKTCLLMTSSWEPSTGILITLWDYFYKRLNLSESFQSSSGTLDGLACIDQSVVSMYERCKQWTQGHIGSLDKETSYQLFLRLMSQHVGKLYSTGSIQEWKQVKGRIYSKFHVRRIQELMEGGLYNLSSLFITLGMTADLEDVASKLCDFYDMLDIHSVTFAKRSVIWRGAFTLILVYIDRNMDVTYLADRMVAAFDNAVSDFGTAGIDSKHSLWKLILIYLEGLQEAVEASHTLQLSEYKLLCPAVQKLLTVCSEHELRSTLSTLHSVIQKFRQVKLEERKDVLLPVRKSLQHAEFGGALWKNVYSFIVEHAQTLTPPPIVADIAASFCLLALTCPSDDSTLSFVTVFQTFASSDKVNVSISCRFLSHLLSCTEVMDRLRSDMDIHEQFIISAWFRCCLHVPAGSQMLVEITRPVLQLKAVHDILRQADVTCMEDIDGAPVLFLKALEKSHRKIQAWQEKMAFQKQVIPYFCDVQKHISPVLRTMGPPEVVHNVFKMAGYLIKFCAKLIYVRQDVIVPSLISSLILPHTVHSPDKPLNPVFLTAIKDHLHLFIQGLSKLPYERDPFVQRRLRDIVTVYLPKFSLRPSAVSMTAASVTTVHPVVASLSGSFIQNPSPDSVKFRHYLIQTVLNNFNTVKNMTVHQNHSMGFFFVHEVIQRTTNAQVKARDLTVLLTVCLEYLLLLPNNSSTWNMVLGTLQQLADAYTSAGQSIQLSDLTVLCEQFISNYFKFSSIGVIRLMEKVALLLQDLVITVVDRLSECVKETENKRGIGVDQKLRGLYYQVLRQLGEEGAREIQKLQSEAL